MYDTLPNGHPITFGSPVTLNIQDVSEYLSPEVRLLWISTSRRMGTCCWEISRSCPCCLCRCCRFRSPMFRFRSLPRLPLRGSSFQCPRWCRRIGLGWAPLMQVWLRWGRRPLPMCWITYRGVSTGWRHMILLTGKRWIRRMDYSCMTLAFWSMSGRLSRLVCSAALRDTGSTIWTTSRLYQPRSGILAPPYGPRSGILAPPYGPRSGILAPPYGPRAGYIGCSSVAARRWSHDVKICRC